ncbi:MAG: DUF302 domain-containing protein [Gemmatimonadales bacterium]
MSKAKKVRKVAKAAVKRVTKAAAGLEKKVEREIRKRRVRRVAREAASVAATTGAGVLAAAALETGVRAFRRRNTAGRLAFEVDLPVPPHQAIERVTEALKAEGFGILTRIDVHNVLQQKLDVAFRPYTILGACNPHLAHRALSHSAEVGLLLPCNVTVEAAEHGGGSVVRIADPEAMLAAGRMDDDDVMVELMEEAHDKLSRVAKTLG